jgi:AsmA protein
MGRPVKFFLWFVAAIAALFAVAAIAFLFLFDANDFKEKVETAVQEETGRELVISGDVSVQIFPWLAVEIGESRLGNAPGFGDEPFAAFDSITLSVQFMPLLIQREIVVGTAEIDGLVLNLAARDDGTDNWSDLAAGGEAEVAAADTMEEAADAEDVGGTLAISGLAIRNAAISYSSGADAYALTDANFTVGPIAGDADALRVGAISLEALVSGLTEIPTDLSFETGGIEVDNAASVATIEPISLSVRGIDMHADVQPLNYADSVQPSVALRVDAFSPRSVMTLLGMEPLETADPSALSKVGLSATAKVGENDISLSGINVEFDDTTFTGSMSVPMSADGRIRVDLKGDAIDLNRYMAPAAEDEVVEEDVAPIEIPVELVRLLNAQGDFGIATVRIANLELENVTLGVNAGGGKLRMHPIHADLFGGSYNGDVRIDASGPTASLSLNENVDGVDLAKLAMAMFEVQNITGSIAGNFKLGGRGNDMNAIRETLSGTMAFELSEGAYEGTDIWYELRRARAALRQETPPEATLPARTQFTKISATGVVTNGVMRNDDFNAELPFMQVTGAGQVDLGGGTVDYGLRARVLSKPELMGGATPEEIEDFTKTVVPLKITGPLTSPSVRPDVEALLRSKVEEKVKEELEDKLKDLFNR